MPGFDKTGPQGEGPRTGRGLGRCGKANKGRRSNMGRDSGIIQDYDATVGSRAGRGRRMGRGGSRRGGRMQRP